MAEIRVFLTLFLIAGCGVEGEALPLEEDDTLFYRDAEAGAGPALTCDCDPLEDLPITYPVEGAADDGPFCYEVTEYCSPICDWPDIALVGRAGRWRKKTERVQCRPFAVNEEYYY